MPDALVLAKMATWGAVQAGHAAGQGLGPVRAGPGFISDPRCMPVMGFDDETIPSSATLERWGQVLRRSLKAHAPLGLYGISDRPERLGALAAQGVPQLQLRLKLRPGESRDTARPLIRAALDAVSAHPGSRLWINDHWEQALAEGARALHLGQEDWAGLTPEQRAQIQSSGVLLGLSSHSLWELARARGLAPHCIACGPVWATTTKDMPWLPQGLSHVAYWSRMAGLPVVAIGGLLHPAQVAAVRRAGASSACLVRALDEHPLEALQAAWHGSGH